MKQEFITAVDAGNITRTRIILSNEMMLDPRGGSFKKMLAYAEAKISDLFEVHDGVMFDMNEQSWNKDLLFSVKNDLDYNFSRERLNYYYEVAKVVLKDKAQSLDKEVRGLSNGEKQQKRNGSNKDLYRGITIVGTVLAATGLFLEKSVVASVIVASGFMCAAIGGILLYKENRK